MKKLGLILLFLTSTSAFAEKLPKVELHWKPKCEKTNPGDWAMAYSSCTQAFMTAKLESFPLSDKVCHCVADEYIQKPSCETLSKMNTDAEFRKVQRDKVVQACRQKSESKTRKVGSL